MDGTSVGKKKNSWWSCVLTVVLFGAIGALNYHLTAQVEPPFRGVMSGVSAFLIALGLSSFASVAAGYGRGASSRATILQRARTDELPVDGATTAITGKVTGLSEPLRSPLSETPCALYMYRMFFYTVNSRGKKSEVPVYWGYSARPFALDSRSTRYRILAVPRLSNKPVIRSGEEAIAKARSWIASTKFEETTPNVIGAVGSAFQMAHDIFTDEDGESTRNWKRKEDPRDPADLVLEETLLPFDVQASAIGTWSSEKGAIVSQDSPIGKTGVAMILGPPENLTSQDGMPDSVTSYLVTATILILIGLGILALAIEVVAARV